MMNQIPDFKDLFSETFSNLLHQSSTFASNLITALLILFIGWLVAKGLAYVLKSFLQRIRVDKLGEKIKDMELLRKYDFDFKLSEIISKAMFIIIMLFVSISATDKLGVPAISNMLLMVINFIPNLFVAMVMTLIGLFVSDLARKFVETLCKSFNISAGKLISMSVFFFLAFISVILALGQAGINTTLLESSFNIIIAGLVLAFSIGYGFASKDVLQNILSSIYSRKKFKIGDTIEIQGIKGTIIDFDNTNITLSVNDTKVFFPLRLLQTEKITIYN